MPCETTISDSLGSQPAPVLECFRTDWRAYCSETIPCSPLPRISSVPILRVAIAAARAPRPLSGRGIDVPGEADMPREVVVPRAAGAPRLRARSSKKLVDIGNPPHRIPVPSISPFDLLHDLLPATRHMLLEILRCRGPDAALAHIIQDDADPARQPMQELDDVPKAGCDN